MNTRVRFLLPAAILLGTLSAAGQTGEVAQVPELSSLLTPAEQRAYSDKPDYRNRAALFRSVIRRLGERISAETAAKNYAAIDEILRALKAVSFHGMQQAGEIHTTKDARSRKVKQLEIALRRLIEDLEDLKLRVHYELRLEYEAVQAQLEEYRSTVLALLFESPSPGNAPLEASLVNRFALPGRSAEASSIPQRRRGDSGIRGDQFTDEEYDKVQDAQELMDRVKVFIEIAESRLTEIERRREGVEWKGEKENPIEFYTVAQMVHAYDRSIEGIMIFIDEKVKLRLAKEKEVKKALTLLNKKIQEFIPHLEPIRLQAIDTKDEELFLEVRSAMKNSDAALKGSQMGLGAPANN